MSALSSPLSVKGPSTIKQVGSEFKIVSNLWYTSARYTFVVEAKNEKDMHLDMGGMFSTNVGFTVLPVSSVQQLYANIKAAHVPGVTLLFDHPYPAFPDNYGTWLEILLPLYGQLSLGTWRKHIPGSPRHIDQVVFVNLKREQIQSLQWAWSMLQLTLAPATEPGREFPRLVFFDELEFMDQTLWISFQHAMGLADRATGGPYAFPTPELGQRFREAAYALVGVPMPARAPPRITYLMSVGGEVVYNNDDVLQSLLDVADLLGLTARPASLTHAAPFRSFVSLMSRTGVLVSRHGPQLANVLFLPPGAVVVELLAFNWDWRGTSDLYFNTTSSIGDLHHFGWRATSSRWVVYTQGPGDEKYADWNIEECTASRQCLEVHARSGMLVDTSAVHEILMDSLPEVGRNATVAQLRKPFPKGAVSGAQTGFWSDK